MILHHGEEGDLLACPPEEGIWKAGCLDWGPDGDVSVFDGAVETAGNLAVCVFPADAGHFVITSGLFALLEGTAAYGKAGSLVFTGFAEGRKIQEESNLATKQLNAERDAALSAMAEKLKAAEEREQNP